MSEEKINALEIENLNVEYHVDKEVVHALNGISFKLAKGKTIGLVGETGAGKTTTGLSILRLIPSPPGVVKGTIKVQGEDISTLSEKQMESIRGNVVSMIDKPEPHQNSRGTDCRSDPPARKMQQEGIHRKSSQHAGDGRHPG